MKSKELYEDCYMPGCWDRTGGLLYIRNELDLEFLPISEKIQAQNLLHDKEKPLSKGETCHSRVV